MASATSASATTHRPGSLLTRLASGSPPAAITFAGQGAGVLTELSTLVAQRPALRDGLAVAAAALADAVGSPAGQASGRFRHGLDLVAWAEDPDAAPPPSYLRSSGVSYPLILVTQALSWRALWEDGLRDAMRSGAIIAASGHSQGLLAALLVAEAGPRGIDDALLARYARLAWTIGTHAARCAYPGTQAPLAAVSGVRRGRLEPLLDEVNGLVAGDAGAAVALVNAPQRIVVGGPPATLSLLRARLATQARDEQRARRDGSRGGAPLHFTWTDLDVDVAFHTVALTSARDELLGALRATPGLLPDPADLTIAVLSPADGDDLRRCADIAGLVATGQLVAPVRWDLVCRALAGLGARWILDLGPGTDVSALTAENLPGRGVGTLALASPEGRRRLSSPGALPQRPGPGYERYAPGVVELPGGRRHLDGRYARHTGRPPVILAGMTPTTTDAPIVAAAANAGFMAELAGGGQPDRWTFERRIAELRELLEPGREVVFNTLLLDRHLWELHISREGLVVEARRDGAPLAGLTVSAGIPDVEEAIALLDALRAAGLELNAFKPGTVAQIRHVLAIADAAPQHTIAVHVEGGRGGGHHSWEELDELLLETYHELRRRENVLVCAGGGIADPARAAELLCGDWSLRYDEPRMPIDAVLVGTAAMACREATASPQVKRALVAASGSTGWVARGTSAGGVTSARSNLDADIHLLDNAAARAAHLLQEVAGDAAAVAERHDEIVAALALTAKPWFGDVEAMTYGELLARFHSACATGRGGRYDDGSWGHPTWRSRARALHERFAARLHPADSGAITVLVAGPADLDDPAAALGAFHATFPAADTTLLHPADAQFFLEVCDRPGKPVPFVPVLDGEVRRWYMADALWQAQDDRLDADAVFVIPGPCSVTGIERVDEPVGALLARFEEEAIGRVLATAAAPVQRERLADPGPVPPPLADVIAGRDGLVAALCAAPSLLVCEDGVMLARPNPLWRIVVPGDEVRARLDDAGRLARIEVLPAGATGERLEIAARGDEVVVTATMPALVGGVVRSAMPMAVQNEPPPAAELVTRWRAAGAGGFVAADDGAGTVDFARRVLGARAEDVPEHPLDPVSTRWSCPAGLAGAHGAATGAAHDGPGLDLALTLAWPAVAAILSCAPFAARLAQLVHTGHAVVPGAAWPPCAGERGEILARVVALDDAGGSPARLTCRARLECDRGEIATVDVTLATLGVAPLTDRRRFAHETHRAELHLASAAEAGWLAEQEWLASASLQAGDHVVVEVACTTDEPRHGRPTWHAAGRVLRDGEPMGSIDWSAPAGSPSRSAADPRAQPDHAAQAPRQGRAHRARGAVASGRDFGAAARAGEHPVSLALAALGTDTGTRQPRPRTPLAEAQDVAPANMDAFARVGGDHNPLHRCVLAARLAGMRRPIVHGAWTAARASAFVVEALCDGDAGALRRWHVDFVAPVALGSTLDFEAARVGVEGGLQVVEVSVCADGEPVARGEALVAASRGALVFTGQGVQRRGLGVDGRARSAAARDVWARADAHTRAVLGFSLLDVVERNPPELRLAGGEMLRHPDGVLHRTEFTQPALLTAAAAQLAELREAGMPRDEACVAGHSVGEFAALLALGALHLEAAVELVHLRGRLIQCCVPRDERGASAYGMAVVDPSRLGGELPAVEGVEVVNENALGRQLGVAGPRAALERLAALLAPGAVRMLPHIDVPFHSSLLQPAVEGLRAELERLVGPVDHRSLVGRWVPNLLGRPFSLSDEFARAAGCEPGDEGPDVLARRLVVELLARQVASPVRWVDTQRALLAPRAAGGVGARRIVEIGPGGAPVLTDLMRTTIATLELPGPEPELLHVEDDRDAVLLTGQPAAPPAGRGEALAALAAADTSDRVPVPAEPEVPPVGRGEALAAQGASDRVGVPAEPAAPPASTPGIGLATPASPPASTPGIGLATPASPPATGPPDDRPIDAGTALRLVLAAQARMRPEQLDDAETLDELFQGASSRRNQVLLDLGRELGLSGADAATRQPIGELVRALRQHGPRYRYPGVYLRDTVAAGLSRALGRSGMTRDAAAAQLGESRGLGPGLVEHVLALVALETRPGPSARGGPLGRLADPAATSPADARALVDRAADLCAGALGIALPAHAPARPEDLDTVAPRREVVSGRVEEALAASARALLDGLGRGGDAPVQPASVADRDRLAILDAELGPARAAEIAPRFDHRRHVRFASAWASARWDLVAAYHEGLRGPIDHDALQRIAAHACEPAVRATASFLARRAAGHGAGELASALEDVAAGRSVPAPPTGVRPVVDIARDGTPIASTEPAPERPLDLLAPLERAAPHLGGTPEPAAPQRSPHAAGTPEPAAPQRSPRLTGTPASLHVTAGLAAALRATLATTPDLRGETALVTGASPGSIAAELVRAVARRRRAGRGHDVHRHAGASARLPRAVPHVGGSGGRAARAAGEPRVVRRRRRARRLARAARDRHARSPRPAHRPPAPDDRRAVRRPSDRRRTRRRRRWLGGRAAAAAAGRAAARRGDRGRRARRRARAHRAAGTLAEPWGLRRRRRLRRDEGRARGAARPPAQRARVVGVARADRRAADRLGAWDRAHGPCRRGRRPRRATARRADVLRAGNGLDAERPRLLARCPRARVRGGVRARSQRQPGGHRRPPRRGGAARRRAARPLGCRTAPARARHRRRASTRGPTGRARAARLRHGRRRTPSRGAAQRCGARPRGAAQRCGARPRGAARRCGARPRGAAGGAAHDRRRGPAARSTRPTSSSSSVPPSSGPAGRRRAASTSSSTGRRPRRPLASWHGCAGSSPSSARATADAGSTPHRARRSTRHSSPSATRAPSRPGSASGRSRTTRTSAPPGSPCSRPSRSPPSCASRSRTRRGHAPSRPPARSCATTRSRGRGTSSCERERRSACRAPPRTAAASRASFRRGSTSRASGSPATCSPVPTAWPS